MSAPKNPKSGTMPYPKGTSASAPQEGRNGWKERPVTHDVGGSTRADRERRSSLEASAVCRIRALKGRVGSGSRYDGGGGVLASSG
jgi:hypothetical protein